MATLNIEEKSIINTLNAYDITIIFMIDTNTLEHHLYNLYGRYETDEEVLEWINKFDKYKDCEIIAII